MPVAQHSHVRVSSAASSCTWARESTVAYRIDLSPSSFPSAIFRPSSQVTPTPPRGSGAREAKPCSVLRPSRLSAKGLLQVRPPSIDIAICTSYAYVLLALFCNQCANKTPLASSTIEGKSAQFTNRSSLSTIVRGSDHLRPLHLAKRSATRLLFAIGSSQLMRRAFFVANKNGSAAPAPAGDWISTIGSAETMADNAATATAMRKTRITGANCNRREEKEAAWQHTGTVA